MIDLATSELNAQKDIPTLQDQKDNLLTLLRKEGSIESFLNFKTKMNSCMPQFETQDNSVTRNNTENFTDSGFETSGFADSISLSGRLSISITHNLILKYLL